MATQAHAPVTNTIHRYRRVARFPIIGANVAGQVSLGSEKDMVILGTIGAFGMNGWQTLTSNFGPINPMPAGGNVVGPTAPTAAMPATAATVNGAPLGSTFHNVSTAATVNGVTTGPTPPTASTASIVNGAATGPTSLSASTHSTVNGTPAVTTNPTASTAPTANLTSNNTAFNFTPMTNPALSNHGLPFELTDLLISFKDCKGIFKCIKDVHANAFTQLAIVALNPNMREALLIPPDSPVTYPIAHMAGTLAFDFNDEALCFEITWLVDHKVEFMVKASTSETPLW